MTKKRIVDNSERPAQPEPDEDPATERPPRIREGGTKENPRRDEERRGKASE